MDQDRSQSLYQGEPPPEEWDSRELKHRALRTVLWVVARSYRHYLPYRRNCDDYFDLYTNQPLKLRQNNRVRSNVPSGLVPEMVDTYMADLLNSMNKSRPVTAVVPEEPNDMDTANVLERKIQYDRDNWTQEMGPLPVDSQVLLQTLMWGSCPVKYMWEERTRNQVLEGVVDPDTGLPAVTPQRGFMGSICEPLFFYDVFPDPLKVWPDDNYPAVHISHQSFDKLQRLKGVVYDDSVDDIPEKSDLDFILGDAYGDFSEAVGDPYERIDQRVRMGWTSDSRLEPDGVVIAECECMFRPDIDWVDSGGRKHKGGIPVRTIITVANGIVIRVTPSPIRDGMSIYGNTKITHLPGQWYGQGLIQKNRPHYHVVDTVLNMWLQSTAQQVNKPKVVLAHKLESGQSLDDTPGGLIRAKMGVEDARGVVQEIQTNSVYNDVIGIINYMTSRGEGAVGMNDLKSGRIPKGETTATESNIAFNQASIRFKMALSWLGSTYVIPSARKAYLYNRDYLDDKFAFRYFGDKGAVHWTTVKQSDFATNVDFVFVGPTQMENESLRIAQLENFLKILSPYIQLGWAEPAIKEIIVDLADKFNIPNLDRMKELIGHGQPAPPPAQEGALGGGVAGPASGRQDRRLGSGDVATGASGLAKSLGGLLSNVR